MRKIVQGSDREEALGEFSDTKIYDKRSDFSDLQLQKSRALRERVYVFIDAGKFKKNQYSEIENLKDTNRDILILVENTDDLPKSLKDGFEVETKGTTDTDDFMDKTKALRRENPTEKQVEKLKRLPLEYLLKRLSRLDSQRFPEVHEVVDYCNQRLYETDQEILHEYLATRITMKDNSIWSRSKEWKEYEDLVERLSEMTGKSQQEVQRGFRTLIASNYEELDLTDTQKRFLAPYQGIARRGIYESPERHPERSANETENSTEQGGLHAHL